MKDIRNVKIRIVVAVMESIFTAFFQRSRVSCVSFGRINLDKYRNVQYRQFGLLLFVGFASAL